MRKMTVLKVSLSCLLVGVFSTMWAAENATPPSTTKQEPVKAAQTDPIKHRHEVFEEVGKNMKAAKKIVGNGKSDALLANAKKVQELTTDIPALFPQGSDKGKTDAKPVIWEKWEDFKKAAQDASTKAGAFVTAVEGDDKAVIKTAFGDLGAACKACHKDFKAED
ncbi:MAG: hypothetical protein BWK79_05790 [Beggiatoa sp. IS2]|nr:MAG: hypothetical protein BWK79_05790 [Beggiatoa sp. IS2]